MVGWMVRNPLSLRPTRSDLCRVYALVFVFSVAPKRLYKRVCPSVGLSVGRSVRRSVATRRYVCDAFVMLLLFGQLGATYAVYTALFVFVGIFVFYLFLLITKVFSHGIKVLIKTAAEKHLRVRGRESEVVDRRQRLRVRASFFLYLVIVSDAVFVLDFVVVSIFVDVVAVFFSMIFLD